VTVLGQAPSVSFSAILPCMGDSLRRTRRLASLLHQLIEEDGAYGAKSRAAKRLGLTPGYAWKIMEGRRDNVSDDVIRDAAKALDLRLDFFDAPGPSEIDYHAFVGAPGVGAWDDWVGGEGASSTNDERDVLRAMAAAAEERGESVTPALLSGMLLALRMSRAAATRR